jgi:uncharacterized protein (DUF427 family)
VSNPIGLPGPEHPIAITPTNECVVVRAGGRVIAHTRHALTLKEASYPPVYYLPREDVRVDHIKPSAHTTYCPYKGDASYYRLPDAENAMWSYENPHPAMAAIRNYLAFYPDRVDALEREE